MKPWPLAISPFTVADRLKIGLWLLRGYQWTAGWRVRAYERRWEQYTGSPHAIMVSNGSAANELIALRRKEELVRAGDWPARNQVIFPVCTWISSVSPWLRLGFRPVWADITTNLCASIDTICTLLWADNAREIGTVFYTTLLGQAADLTGLRAICADSGRRLMLDNCESAFSWNPESLNHKRVHFCAVATSSASFYFSHHTTTGTEGGMIFCSDNLEADWYRMMRNHGLTRGMSAYYRNPDVHPAFDFYLPGTNARSSDLQAYMGSLIFARSLSFTEERMRLATLFYRTLDQQKFDDVAQGPCQYPLMALPIVPNGTQRFIKCPIAQVLDRLKIEHRPIVGGNLLRHTALKGHGNPANYPRAQWVHDHGLYVGLHEGITEDMVVELAETLNK